MCECVRERERDILVNVQLIGRNCSVTNWTLPFLANNCLYTPLSIRLLHHFLFGSGMREGEREREERKERERKREGGGKRKERKREREGGREGEKKRERKVREVECETERKKLNEYYVERERDAVVSSYKVYVIKLIKITQCSECGLLLC